MIYGYARVSTLGQKRDGNSLEGQREALEKNGAEIIYSDAFTGTKTSRPELDKLLNEIKEGDRLVVTKLDRMARSATEGFELIQGLLDKGVEVHVLNMGLLDNTPTGKLITQVMLAFAEFERNMIVERTQEGKAIKRATDPLFKEGRPKRNIRGFESFSRRVGDGRKKDGLSISVGEACERLGISRSTYYRRMADLKK